MAECTSQGWQRGLPSYEWLDCKDLHRKIEGSSAESLKICFEWASIWIARMRWFSMKNKDGSAESLNICFEWASLCVARLSGFPWEKWGRQHGIAEHLLGAGLSMSGQRVKNSIGKMRMAARSRWKYASSAPQYEWPDFEDSHNKVAWQTSQANIQHYNFLLAAISCRKSSCVQFY